MLLIENHCIIIWRLSACRGTKVFFVIRLPWLSIIGHGSFSSIVGKTGQVQLGCFYAPSLQTQVEENIKAWLHWPLWEEFTGKTPQHSGAPRSGSVASEATTARSSPRASGRRHALSLASQFKMLVNTPPASTGLAVISKSRWSRVEENNPVYDELIHTTATLPPSFCPNHTRNHARAPYTFKDNWRKHSNIRPYWGSTVCIKW